MIDKLKKLFYEIKKGQDKYKIDKKVPSSWKGNDHAGFYVVENKLDASGVVLSFGVGEDISFDLEVHKLSPNSTIHLFDPTPKAINFVKNQGLGESFKFHPYGLDKDTGTRTFLLPVNDNHVSGSLMNLDTVDETKKIEVQMKSFEDIIQELGIDNVSLLKMDIEGSEYDVLDAVLGAPIKIKQICIEFHTRFFEDGKQRTNLAIEKLKNAGYSLIRYGYNAEEFTFLKNEN